MTAYKDGAFVFHRASSACIPMLPSEIERLAAQHNLPASIVPQYAGDRAQVSRAISATTSRAQKQGWQLTSIKTGRHEVVYGISLIERDQTLERVDFTFDARLRWSDEAGNGQYVEGTHQIACDVDTAYQAIRGRICPGDWTDALTTYLVGECAAFAFREDGRVYWCPSTTMHTLAALGAFLEQVGISLVVCEVESETRTVVQQAAQESLADRLQQLQDEVSNFDGKQKPSNYKRRIEEIVGLRKRATVYAEALQVGVDQAQAILAQLEAQVQTLLDVRENTVVHRSGAVSAVGTPGSVPVDTMAQSFAAVPGIRASSEAYAARDAVWAAQPAFSW